MRRPHFIKHLARALALAVVITAVFGALAQFLWNHLVPQLFHLPALGYWQAVGLLILGRLFFGRFGRPGGPHPFGHHGRFGGHPHDGRLGGPERDLDIQGGPRSWRRYGAYWNAEGKAHFEAWLKGQDPST
jgi:hypothetical protein